eukprot:6868056-Pyramimonas_sp.AAC.1
MESCLAFGESPSHPGGFDDEFVARAWWRAHSCTVPYVRAHVHSVFSSRAWRELGPTAPSAARMVRALTLASNVRGAWEC